MDNDPSRISRQAWDANAEVWDARMGDEGNDFFDFSAELIKPAKSRRNPDSRITYHVIDATDESALLARGEHAFPPGHPQGSPLGWSGKLSEIPPVPVARLRGPGS
jgi:hypothetical protein